MSNTDERETTGIWGCSREAHTMTFTGSFEDASRACIPESGLVGRDLLAKASLDVVGERLQWGFDGLGSWKGGDTIKRYATKFLHFTKFKESYGPKAIFICFLALQRRDLCSLLSPIPFAIRLTFLTWSHKASAAIKRIYVDQPCAKI